MDPHVDDENWFDTMYDKDGYFFFIPSRLTWKMIKHKIIDSDYVVIESNDGPLERFTFRKV